MALVTTPFYDSFDSFNHNVWAPSTHEGNGWWQYNGWSASNVQTIDGRLRLELNTDDMGSKDFTGAEIQSDNTFGYGRYETTMKSSGEVGVASTFFTYTGRVFGMPWNEVDVELMGKEHNFIHIAYHNGGTSYARDLPLGFDHSAGFHTYAFEWEPGVIRWYVDGRLLHTVESDTVPSNPSRLYMNLWTGLDGWLGKATFTGETEALYESFSFQPYVPGEEYGDLPTTPTPPPPITVRANVFLYDAETDTRLERLTDGEHVPSGALGSGELTLVVQPRGTSAAAVESVTIEVDGPGDADWARTESLAPYALFGDAKGVDFAGRIFPEGEYTATVTSWSGNGGAGRALGNETLTFVLGDDNSVGLTPSDLKIILFEVGTGRELQVLNDDATVDLDSLTSGRFNIRAVVPDDADVESVRFELDGRIDHRNVENLAPYNLFSGPEAPAAAEFATGTYRIKVDLYTLDNAAGQLLGSSDLDLVFV